MLVKKVSVRILLLMCLTALLLGVAGCSQGTTPKEKARVFAEKVFSVPSKEFLAIKETILSPGDIPPESEATNLSVVGVTPEYEAAIQGAMESLFAQDVDPQVLLDSGSKLYQEVMLIQIDAITQDYSYTVDKVEITEHGENNYRYQVTITAAGEKEKIVYVGSIQFNGEGLINYFTVELPA